jgi:nitrate/nitrite transporter NarK
MTVIGATLVTGITIFTVVIPNELRGLCMAILAGAQVLFGVALAPMAVSWIATAAGGPMMIGRALALVCVAASIMCTICFLFGRHRYLRLHRDLRPAGT